MENIKRQSIEEYWLEVANTVSKRSLCEGSKVGAVLLTADGRVASTGYNGPPSGFSHKDSGCSNWCDRQKSRESYISEAYGLHCPSVHAEINALMFADRMKYEGGTLFVTSVCCGDCTKIVSNSGVKKVVMEAKDEDSKRNIEGSFRFFEKCGIKPVILNRCRKMKEEMEKRIKSLTVNEKNEVKEELTPSEQKEAFLEGINLSNER